MWSEPITDRSQSDISYAKENQNGSTDNKGALNYNDLNRIENNFKYLIEKLKNDAIYIQHMNRNFEETVYEIQEEELPYTELEYIESNGTQYINTGINPTSNLIIKAKFLITDTPSNFYALYGSRNSGDSLAYWVFLNYTDGKIVLRYKTRTNTAVEEVNAVSGIHFLEQNNNKITIDGYSAVADTNTIESTYPIYLFANNNVNSPQYQSHMRFYYFQIYDNDTLVRDFIPAKDKNNVVCLYDSVSDTFFYNAGTGDFIAGDEISGEKDENTVLLIHGDELLDSSIYKVPIENTGVTNVTTKTNLSEKSLYFNGSSYLKIDMSDLNYDFNADWTWEWWDYYINNTNKSGTLCVTDGEYGLLAGTPSNNNIRIYAKEYIDPSTIGTYNNTKFVHRAICKKGNKVYAFENGIKTLEYGVSGEYNHSNILYIGYRGHPSNAGYFNGYMDEIRISNIARWTEDFEPPTEPYSNTVVTETGTVVEIKKTYTEWFEENTPYLSEINRIRNNYNNLVADYLYGLGFPYLEDSSKLTYEEINTWERIALKCKEMIENMEKSYIYCGTIQSGGGILL